MALGQGTPPYTGTRDLGRGDALRLRLGGAGVGPGGAGQDDRHQRAGRPHDPPLQELQRPDHHGEQGAGG